MNREKLELYEEHLNVAIQLLEQSHPNNEVIDELEDLADEIGNILLNTKEDVSVVSKEALEVLLEDYYDVSEGFNRDEEYSLPQKTVDKALKELED